jgi:hypothetical protein
LVGWLVVCFVLFILCFSSCITDLFQGSTIRRVESEEASSGLLLFFGGNDFKFVFKYFSANKQTGRGSVNLQALSGIANMDQNKVKKKIIFDFFFF